MNKQYLLEQIEQQLNVLRAKYRSYCSETGPSKSDGGRRNLRCRTKKDMDVLKLLKYLITCLPDSFILDDEDMEVIFDRLTETKR